MTTNEILALAPGPQLDQAIHALIFGGIGKCASYSTKDSAGIKILDRLPLFVSRVPDNHPARDPSRPFAAGRLVHAPELNGDVTNIRVTAQTRMVALCKAALIVAAAPAKLERAAVPMVSAESAAHEIAARIGTPAARNPAARNPAARIAQPTSRLHANDRQPMPKRSEKFVPAEPIASPGSAPVAL